MELKTADLVKKYEYAWDKYEEADHAALNRLGESYRQFMSKAKTERECALGFAQMAEKEGFLNLQELLKNPRKLATGDKVYALNMEKNLALFVIGEEPIEKGMNILGAHIDSPRLDLKQNPLYEDSELALFKTHYYGGIKKYQWVTIPLAIHGVLIKADGTRVEVVIGEDPKDPVFGLSDLLVHLSGEQMDKKASKVIEGEDMNLLVGSIPLPDPEAKDRVKQNVLKLLHEKYGIIEEDFVSAELELVPAGEARDYGLDRSMIYAYGQDDRVCAYTSYEAIKRIERPRRTSVGLFVDKEEIGSAGATGMMSKFFENTVAEIMNLCEDYSELKLRRGLANSKMLSSDVSSAHDPNFAGVDDKRNAAFLGKGIVFNKYSGSRGKYSCNDANPEFMAELRGIMKKHSITWQTAELGKVDQGGGGTIANILAEYNMQVIDCGVALLNMHAPWEISSKADIYETEKAYYAFLVEA